MDITLSPRKNLATVHCRILIRQGERDYHTLMDQSKASRATVFRLLKSAKNACPSPRKKTGPRPTVSSPVQHTLRRMAYKWPHYSNAMLATSMERRTGIKVSPKTIGRNLKKMGIQRKRPRPVPHLTEAHKRKRLAWCLAHRETDWTRIVFFGRIQVPILG